MIQTAPSTAVDVQTRALDLFDHENDRNYRFTDRMFACLMPIQFAAGIGAALLISPRTWIGASSHTHLHVWAAFLFGGLLAGFPLLLVWRRPGLPLTRHVIAASQVLFSALLIHLTGGRIETHFHIFGSLAFLAFYRDWKVLATATLIVALDHMLRGIYWPQSVFGVFTPSKWRWMEHVGWVAFEDIFLFIGVARGTRQLRQLSLVTARLEAGKDAMEEQVRKRTEQLNSALRSAESASRAKSEFLANMSHEVRTPLHAVMSFARFGADRASTADPAKMLDYFQKIQTSGNRLMVLLSDVLDLAKMDVGMMRYEFKVTDMRLVLQSVRQEFSSLLADQNLRLEYRAPDSEVLLPLHASRMSQVVRNLLSNAIKFSSPGATIWMHLSEAAGHVQISVRDQGPGVPEDELASIFEKFVQSTRTKTGAGGAGLGLAICREIVVAHQGRMWAENDPRGGAVLHVELPITREATSSPESDRQVTMDTPHKQVRQPADMEVS